MRILVDAVYGETHISGDRFISLVPMALAY